MGQQPMKQQALGRERESPGASPETRARSSAAAPWQPIPSTKGNSALIASWPLVFWVSLKAAAWWRDVQWGAGPVPSLGRVLVVLGALVDISAVCPGQCRGQALLGSSWHLQSTGRRTRGEEGSGTRWI